jgi:hypothetical protein
LKQNKSVEKKPVLKSCQKAKAKAAQAAAQGETVHINNPIFSTLCEDNLKYAYIPNVFDPETHEPLVKFASMKPRKYQLRRKVNWKKEAKALYSWNESLESLLTHASFITSLTPNLVNIILSLVFFANAVFFSHLKKWQKVHVLVGSS